MRLNKFLFLIIILCFSCSVVSAGSLELRLKTIEGTPVEHINEVCLNLGMSISLDLVYVSEPGWRICGIDCEIIKEESVNGLFEISDVYWTHDWDIPGQCEITPELNVHLSACDIIGDGQQPGIVVGNITYWAGECCSNLLVLTTDITLYEKEIDGPGERVLTLGDGLYIIQGTALKWTDINGDFFIDSLDYAKFSEAWLSRPGDENWDVACDFNLDDYVGAYDLALICHDWLCYSYDCYCKLRE